MAINIDYKQLYLLGTTDRLVLTVAYSVIMTMHKIITVRTLQFLLTV